jgi:DNA-binding transcriptional MerR regulator
MRYPQNPITTGAAARILHTSESTVRNLEQRGVLTVVRTESGLRLFDPEQCHIVAARRAAEAAQRDARRRQNDDEAYAS